MSNSFLRTKHGDSNGQRVWYHPHRPSYWRLGGRFGVQVVVLAFRRLPAPPLEPERDASALRRGACPESIALARNDRPPLRRRLPMVMPGGPVDRNRRCCQRHAHLVHRQGRGQGQGRLDQRVGQWPPCPVRDGRLLSKQLPGPGGSGFRCQGSWPRRRPLSSDRSDRTDPSDRTDESDRSVRSVESVRLTARPNTSCTSCPSW